MSTTKPKSKRQLAEDALEAFREGRWEDVVALNREVIERDPKDAEAFNRIGRAQLALGDLQGAYESYTRALKADPANLIARRNLQRLDQLRQGKGKAPTTATTDLPRHGVFVEEIGRTWVDELVNPTDARELAGIYAGTSLKLEKAGDRLVVVTQDGRRLGEIDAKTAERLLEMIAAGNIYEVYALGLSGKSLRVIVREVYRDPKVADRVSFPRQVAATRAYLKERDLLRAQDESDFLHDEEDEELEEADISPTEPGEDEEGGSSESQLPDDVNVIISDEEEPVI